MTDPARAQTVDTEIAKHCAYSLPGVALTLGRQNWHCLKDTYETLASDVQVKYKAVGIALRCLSSAYKCVRSMQYLLLISAGLFKVIPFKVSSLK